MPDLGLAGLLGALGQGAQGYATAKQNNLQMQREIMQTQREAQFRQQQLGIEQQRNDIMGGRTGAGAAAKLDAAGENLEKLRGNYNPADHGGMSFEDYAAPIYDGYAKQFNVPNYVNRFRPVDSGQGSVDSSGQGGGQGSTPPLSLPPPQGSGPSPMAQGAPGSPISPVAPSPQGPDPLSGAVVGPGGTLSPGAVVGPGGTLSPQYAPMGQGQVGQGSVPNDPISQLMAQQAAMAAGNQAPPQGAPIPDLAGMASNGGPRMMPGLRVPTGPTMMPGPTDTLSDVTRQGGSPNQSQGAPAPTSANGHGPSPIPLPQPATSGVGPGGTLSPTPQTPTLPQAKGGASSDLTATPSAVQTQSPTDPVSQAGARLQAAQDRAARSYAALQPILQANPAFVGTQWKAAQADATNLKDAQDAYNSAVQDQRLGQTALQDQFIKTMQGARELIKLDSAGNPTPQSVAAQQEYIAQQMKIIPGLRGVIAQIGDTIGTQQSQAAATPVTTQGYDPKTDALLKNLHYMATHRGNAIDYSQPAPAAGVWQTQAPAVTTNGYVPQTDAELKAAGYTPKHLGNNIEYDAPAANPITTSDVKQGAYLPGAKDQADIDKTGADTSGLRIGNQAKIMDMVTQIQNMQPGTAKQAALDALGRNPDVSGGLPTVVGGPSLPVASGIYRDVQGGNLDNSITRKNLLTLPYAAPTAGAELTGKQLANQKLGIDIGTDQATQGAKVTTANAGAVAAQQNAYGASPAQIQALRTERATNILKPLNAAKADVSRLGLLIQRGLEPDKFGNPIGSKDPTKPVSADNPAVKASPATLQNWQNQLTQAQGVVADRGAGLDENTRNIQNAMGTQDQIRNPAQASGAAAALVGTDFGTSGCTAGVYAWAQNSNLSLPTGPKGRPLLNTGDFLHGLAKPNSGWVQTQDPTQASIFIMPGSGGSHNPSGLHTGVIARDSRGNTVTYQADSHGDTRMQMYPNIPSGKGVTYWKPAAPPAPTPTSRMPVLPAMAPNPAGRQVGVTGSATFEGKPFTYHAH